MKTLQLEQMAVAGHAEEPSVVASQMQLVFSTLEVYHFSPIFRAILDKEKIYNEPTVHHLQ